MLKNFGHYWRSNSFQKLFRNTTWSLGDKVLRLLVSLGIGIVVARYLGPERAGILAYAVSLVTMIAMLNHLGLDGLTVRELVKHPRDEQKILGTVFVLKLAASSIATAIIICLAFFTSEVGSTEFYLLVVMSIYCIFEPKSVVSFWFESKLLVRYTSISNVLSLVFVAVIKITFVVIGVSLFWFGLVFVLESMLIFILSFYLISKVATFSLLECRFEQSIAKSMLSRGWMIMFGAIFAAIYRKVDQAMLMWMASEKDVGNYAVAAQLSEAWAFVPIAIVASFFPGLVKMKDVDGIKYHQQLQSIFDLLAFLAIGLAVATTFVAEPLINAFYGDAFSDAATILVIHIWSCVFVFFRALFGRWIHLEQVFLFSLMTQGIGAVFNVLLNFWLIPKYSGYGAAIATLISYGMASFGSLLFHPKSRPVFIMMCKSLFIYLRLPFLLKRFALKE